MIENEKKIIELKGGIGNQLFQFAFGQYLKSQKKEVIFNNNWFNDNERKFLLDKFIKNLTSADIESSKRNFIPNEKLTNFLIDNKLPYPSKLSGYWQKTDYARHINKSYFKDNLVKENIKSEYYIFHVRRGDYLESQNHKIIPSEFYKNLTNLFKKKIFIISEHLSDAIELKNYIDHKEIEIFEGNEIETFNFIINSKGGVVSNSTFCWWPAFLSENSTWIASNIWLKNTNFIDYGLKTEKIFIMSN